MANAANLGAFVQATILDPRTGKLSVYTPLVITQGTKPAVAPVVPKLPQGAIVTIDFGFNGGNLFQVGATADALTQGRCVNGTPGSVFGQVSFCNGQNFFRMAFMLMAARRVHVPSAGTSANMVPTAGRLGSGRACPTVRNFEMIDQDQSDNVTSQYLIDPNTGLTAQATAANKANMGGAVVLSNGSDNALLDRFLDPLFGCAPFTAPDLADNGAPATSQALDELLAARNPARTVALVPENNPMTLDGNGQFSQAKTNLYRSEVGQPPVSLWTNRTSSPAMYCQNMINIQAPFLAANQNLLATGPTPVANVGNNLFTFMANRLSQSFANLNCQNFGLKDPVTVNATGDNGAATDVTLNTTPQQAANAGVAGQAGAGQAGQGQGDGGMGAGMMQPGPAPSQQAMNGTPAPAASGNG
jgi:hypothetical protein